MFNLDSLNIDNLRFIENRQDMNGQWDQSRLLFDHFYLFLKKRGLRPKTIARKINSVVLFIMNYVHPLTDIQSMNEITGEVLDIYIAEFYVVKFPDSFPSEDKAFKKSIIDFFSFLHKEGFISRKHLKNIKNFKFKLKGSK